MKILQIDTYDISGGAARAAPPFASGFASDRARLSDAGQEVSHFNY